MKVRIPISRLLTVSLTLMTVMVLSRSVAATKATCGKVVVELIEPASGDDDYRLSVKTVSSTDFEWGELILRLPPLGDAGEREILLWEGKRAKRDTITTTYNIGSLPVGRHKFLVELDWPRRTSGCLGVSGAAYVEVGETDVTTSSYGFWHIDHERLMADLRARGLENASMEEIEKQDPEMVRRLREQRSTVADPGDSETSPSPRQIDRDVPDSVTATGEIYMPRKLPRMGPAPAAPAEPESTATQHIDTLRGGPRIINRSVRHEPPPRRVLPERPPPQTDSATPGALIELCVPLTLVSA